MRCAWCAYDLDGIAPDGACPECGIPIERSVRFLDAGSPWQIRRGLRGFMRTARAVLFRPRSTMRRLHPGSGDNTLALCAITIGVYGISYGQWLVDSGTDRFRRPAGSVADFLLVLLQASVMAIPLSVIGVLVVMLQLYLIDALVRRIATRRRPKTTETHARQIQDHATLGFMLWGILTGIAAAAGCALVSSRGGAVWRRS